MLAFVVLGLASCGTTTEALYSWYNYEDATYQYNKTHTEELKTSVLAQYKLITEKQKAVRGAVPPGLNSEYGYMLCKMGKKEEGLKYLQQEITLYPESEKFVSRIIKQIEK